MDKELLFKPRLDEADVEIAGVGTVRVRALSRFEVISITKASDLDADGPRLLTLERKMLAAAMLDPVLTESEVKRWQEASAAGEMVKLIETIQRMSGMLEGVDKDAYKSVRE
jgi:hypothetical protein